MFACLYELVLGGSWNDLAAGVRDFHRVTGRIRAAGRLSIVRGAGVSSSILGVLLGLPPAGENLPSHLSVERVENAEI